MTVSRMETIFSISFQAKMLEKENKNWIAVPVIIIIIVSSSFRVFLENMYNSTTICGITHATSIFAKVNFLQFFFL